MTTELIISFPAIKQGSKPTVTFNWPLPDSHTPTNFAGAVVTGVMRNTLTDSVTAITGALTVTDAVNRTISWQMSDEDVGTAGSFQVTFKAILSSTTLYTLYAKLFIEENPNATAVAGPMLVGVPEADADWLALARATVPNAANLVSATTLGTAAYIDDAPEDGTIYARQDGAWVGVVGGGANLYTIVVASDGSGDYTSISAALAAASPGDAIFIRNGTYAGGVTIDKAGLKIVGESRAVEIQSPLAATPAISITAADVVLENVTINGRRGQQTGSGSHLNFVGLMLAGADRAVIRGVRIYDTLGNGITLSSAAQNVGVTIENCSIENIATNDTTPTLQPVLVGIQVFGNNSRQARIINNFVTGWSQGIGVWYGANDCFVAGNRVINNYGYYNGQVGGTRSAIEDYGATATTHGRNIWRDNIIDGSTSCCIECAQGVDGSQFLNNVCSNYNKFGDNTGSPIVVVDGGATERTQNIIVRGNRFVGHNVQGVVSIRGINVTYVNNHHVNFTHSSIVDGCVHATGAANTGFVFTENTFDNCRGGLVLDSSFPDGAIVHGNRWLTPVAANIKLIDVRAGGRHVIDSNYMTGATGVIGLQITATAGSGHRITNNTFLSFTSWCIDVRQSHCIVTHNHCVTTNVFGAINIDGASANYNQVRWNYCDPGGNVRAIQLQNNAAYNIIQENMLVGSTALVYDQTNAIVWPANNGTISTPNDRSTLTYRIPVTGRALGAQTVGTTQVAIAHGLPWTPREVRIRMTSVGTIWESAAADNTNIYLTADAAGRTCQVIVL